MPQNPLRDRWGGRANFINGHIKESVSQRPLRTNCRNGSALQQPAFLIPETAAFAVDLIGKDGNVRAKYDRIPLPDFFPEAFHLLRNGGAEDIVERDEIHPVDNLRKMSSSPVSSWGAANKGGSAVEINAPAPAILNKNLRLSIFYLA